MIRLLEKYGRLYAEYVDDYDIARRVDYTPFLTLGGKAAAVILDPVLKYFGRASSRSIQNYLTHFAHFGRALEALNYTRLPVTAGEWQELVRAVHYRILTNPESQASLDTRVKDYLSVILYGLRHLQDEDIIPASVVFPQTTKLYKDINYRPYLDSLIGEGAPEEVKEFPQKLLCEISIARTDAEYLDEYHDRLRKSRNLLRGCLIGYWITIKEHILWGQKAIDEINVDEVFKHLKTEGAYSDGKNKHDNTAEHYCNLHTTVGLKRFLAVSHHLYGGLPSYDKERYDNILPRIYADTELSSAIPGHPFPTDYQTIKKIGLTRQRIRWLLGKISVYDIIILSALVIMEQPSFSPEGISKAKIVNKNGKKYIETNDSKFSFTIKKDRAKIQKKEMLTDWAADVICFFERLYEEKRNELRKENNPSADMLFLPYDVNGNRLLIVSSSSGLHFLSGTNLKNISGIGGKIWFGDYFPKLIDEGMGPGRISLKKIRNTEGVLEWFDKDNTKMMARRLANKNSTTITHYIPQPLLTAWNIRKIRRFQNLWIIVAAAKEDFLFEATDFDSVETLHSFIVEMLSTHKPGSSPLTDKLHQLMGITGSEGTSGFLPEGSLQISLSNNSVTALYLYQIVGSHVLVSHEARKEPDRLTGLSPNHFFELAKLLQSNLPGHTNPEFRRIHEFSKSRAAQLAEKVRWADLFMKKGGA